MLIALDWGTSALRATLLDDGGEPLAARSEPWGILHLPAGGFPAALHAITAGWPDAAPVLASGMVGSRQGWHEAPYLPVPSAPEALAASVVFVPGAHRSVAIVPGLRDDGGDGVPDLMRGEETEAVGAVSILGKDATALLVMPGTHAKWALVAGGAIRRFRTFMTGELRATLLRHSILGRLVPDETAAPPPPPTSGERGAAFGRGVRAGHAVGALPLLFSVRALPLTGALDPALVPDYLSGLLLGDEIRAGVALDAGHGDQPGPSVAVVGDGPLATLTADAFAVLGRKRPRLIEGAALAGLVQIARHRSWLAGDPPPC